MKELDPDGLNRRAAKRLKRRDYTSKVYIALYWKLKI